MVHFKFKIKTATSRKFSKLFCTNWKQKRHILKFFFSSFTSDAAAVACLAAAESENTVTVCSCFNGEPAATKQSQKQAQERERNAAGPDFQGRKLDCRNTYERS